MFRHIRFGSSRLGRDRVVICYKVAAEDPLYGKDNAATTHLYRIAQEAINNGIKHGKAREVTVRLRRDSGSAQLVVTDHGTGFPKERTNHGGMGLQIMKYRAGMIGASLEIRPANGRGTMVVCTFKPST